MVPLDPAQARAVRRPAWVRHEVGPAHDHLGLGRPDRAGPQVEPDDLVDHVGRASARVVALPHADQRAAIGRHRAVGPAVPPGDGRLGRDRLRIAAGREAVEPLVRPAHEPHDPVPHPPRSPAVLVRRGPRVASLGEDLSGAPVRTSAHELGAPSLLRALLRPPQVVAVGPHLRQPGGGPDDQLRGDRRGPGAVRKDRRTGTGRRAHRRIVPTTDGWSSVSTDSAPGAASADTGAPEAPDRPGPAHEPERRRPVLIQPAAPRWAGCGRPASSARSPRGWPRRARVRRRQRGRASAPPAPTGRPGCGPARPSPSGRG